MAAIKREEQIGPCRLLLGDCFQILPHLPPVDAVVTDPPYGINATKRDFGNGPTSRMRGRAWDAAAVDLSPVLALAVPTVVWGGNYYPLPPSRKYLVWDKGAGFRGRDFAECEMAWCSEDGNARVLNRDPLACGDYRDKKHKTQKPVAVMEWSLAQVAGELVLDPFMGSGTTGVACIRMGRRFVGIEIDEECFELAVARNRMAWQEKLSEIPFDEPPVVHQPQLF